MIELINSSIGIRPNLLRTAQTAISQIPHKLHSASHQHREQISTRANLWRRSITKGRESWLIETAQTRSNSGIAAPLVIPEGTTQLNPRQWLTTGNPLLNQLVSETIDDRWTVHLEALQQLEPLSESPAFQKQWQALKRVNKRVLADRIYDLQGISIDVDSLFDVQLQAPGKQQRQLLNILHIITLFNRLKDNPQLDIVPRTFIFGETESVNYPEETSDSRVTALLIRSLTNILAGDLDVKGRLQVVYLPQSAGLNDRIYAAADLTEQIEVAQVADLDLSKLKFAGNGAISIGSLSKANQIVQQTVGADNYFAFGLAIPEIALFKEYGYDPNNYYKYYPEIQQAIDSLLAGEFTPGYPAACRSLIDNLFDTDEEMVLADYIFYLTAQAQVSDTYRQQSVWTKMSIMNVAGLG